MHHLAHAVVVGTHGRGRRGKTRCEAIQVADAVSAIDEIALRRLSKSIECHEPHLRLAAAQERGSPRRIVSRGEVRVEGQKQQ